MSILTEPLPQSVYIGDVEYPLNTDFRVSFQFESTINNPTLSEDERIIYCLELYYGRIPVDIDTALEAAIAFFQCNQEPDTEGTPNDPAYSFEYDAPYICAAFMQQYGIDLLHVDYMHWWQFKALFDGLTKDTRFIEIVGYRVAEPYNGMSSEERDQMNKLKRAYALPEIDTRTPEQIEADERFNAIALGKEKSADGGA